MPISDSMACLATDSKTESSAACLRLGQISFINSLPVVLPIERQLVPMPPQTEQLLADPASLNKLFAAGDLHLGAMSAFYYLASGEFSLIPGISIACRGPVGSVLFFARQPLERMKQARIKATCQSATSINLLKLLFAHEFGFQPQVEEALAPSLDDPEADGILLIGDQALVADQALCAEDRSGFIRIRVDLGQWWWQTFKLPMVFGVWAMRNTWAQGHGAGLDSQLSASVDLSQISSALVQAKGKGLNELLPEVIELSSLRTGLSAARLKRYFLDELKFELDDECLQGLELYRQLAQKYELIKK